MLAHRRRRWANIKTTMIQRALYGSTCLVESWEGLMTFLLIEENVRVITTNYNEIPNR